VVAVAVALTASAAGLAGSRTASGPATLPAWSCKRLVYGGEGTPDAVIVSDLPLQGPRAERSLAMSKAIELVLTQRKFKAGKKTVGYQSCDDATRERGAWDPAKCTANAAEYVEERSVLGVIGPLDSVCAKLALPLLNRARGGRLVLISPGATDPALTRSIEGFSGPGEPFVFYPTKQRNFARVVTTDDAHVPALAELARRIGARPVFVLHDGRAESKAVAAYFELAAGRLGLDIAGNERWRRSAPSYEGLAEAIRKTGARGVFIGGGLGSNGGKLIKDLRTALGDSFAILAPAGFGSIENVVDAGGLFAEGMYLTVAGHPFERPPAAGQRFLAAYDKFTKTPADQFTLYAAQAADLLLDAIAKSDGTRADVTRLVLKSPVRGGLLGSFRFDANGDTTLRAVTVYRIRDGEAAVDRVISPIRP
jgi:branched-chain amino acid transport system substrate-binding protein